MNGRGLFYSSSLTILSKGLRRQNETVATVFRSSSLKRRKNPLQTKLEKLNDQSRKDDVVTFEELGIDRLFIDESHYYKNLYLYTKMRNVGGIAQTEAQKSSDLFMKCRYLDEITGGAWRCVCDGYADLELNGRTLYDPAVFTVQNAARPRFAAL